MSINTKGSLGRMMNTIDASKDSFKGIMGSSIEKPLQYPERVRLKLISDGIENIPTNIGSNRGRNGSLNTLNSNTQMNVGKSLQMVKSNTLTRLRPNCSNEFQKNSLLQSK